jgi:hypothetical protein
LAPAGLNVTPPGGPVIEVPPPASDTWEVAGSGQHGKTALVLSVRQVLLARADEVIE